MDKYLNLLAKQILKEVPQGLSKVRFAKTLYFSHKELVKNHFADFLDLKYIRMPLGPVPVGFKELATDPDINVLDEKNSLSYDSQIYTLKNSSIYFDNSSVVENLKALLLKLHNLPTSELVAISHKDPSWINHVNGDEYFITCEDLKTIGISSKENAGISIELDNQRLQAKLLEGMLNEIVDESTSLEYPN